MTSNLLYQILLA